MINKNKNKQPGKPRIAILGATRGAHLVQRHWLPQDIVEVAALCDLNRPLAEAEKKVFSQLGASDVKLFEDAGEMFSWGEFDGVLVATGDATHAGLGCEVFSHGFHCFIEKPMTTDVESGRALYRAWKKSGKIGVAGHEFRHNSLMLAAKERIAKGDIGQPRLAITIDSCGRMGSYWRRARWRKSQRDPRNSLTLQKAIHQLDIQTFLMGERPAKVYASGSEDHYGGDRPSDHRCSACEVAGTCPYHTSRIMVNGKSRTEPIDESRVGLCVFSNDTDLHDNQTVSIDYKNGSRGSYVECFFTPDYKVEHTIIGDQGRVAIHYLVGEIKQQLELSFIGSTRQETISMDCVGGHGGGDNRLGWEFARGMREGIQVQPDLVEGFYAVSLASSIDASRASGQPTAVPEIETP